ncbi:MAG: ABC transporter ATP-binding protein [Eubacteriales bacterium]|nr:ABC transporter ATP-binding protein [Eubacteriales bacterium]
MNKTETVFSVEGLRFAYPGSAPLFDGLDLSVSDGRITTILGQNGCGKSTLLHLLSRGLKADAGHIFYRGRDIRSMGQREFAGQVAMVHQKNTVPRDVTVEMLVGYGRTPHCSLWHGRKTEHDREVIEWALRLTDTAEIRHRCVAALSGGQLQRVWIAMALAQETKVIFLDEPTTYLDVRYQIEIMNLVRRLNREHAMTVVMVLHDINQALGYSDEIIAMRAGRLVCQREADHFYDTAVLAKIYDTALPVYHTEAGAIVRTF